MKQISKEQAKANLEYTQKQIDSFLEFEEEATRLGYHEELSSILSRLRNYASELLEIIELYEIKES